MKDWNQLLEFEMIMTSGFKLLQEQHNAVHFHHFFS